MTALLENKLFDNLVGVYESAEKNGVIYKLRNNYNSRSFTDNSSPYTPNRLCRRILDSVLRKNKTTDLIGVFFTVEFAAELHKRGYENVVVITEKFCPETKKITEVMGYKYLLIEETDNKNMKFDVIVGNPPYAINSIKGGNSIYHLFAIKALNLANTVAFVTPGTWTDYNRKTYNELYNKINERGLVDLQRIPPDTFGKDNNIVMPMFWIASSKGQSTVEDLIGSPEEKLFSKIVKNQKSFDVVGGKKVKLTRSDKSNNNIPKNISFVKTESHQYAWMDRIVKDGSGKLWIDQDLFFTNGPFAMFAQRGGNKPYLVFEEENIGYSENVIAIKVHNYDQFQNLKTLFSTKIYQFLLKQLCMGKERNGMAMPKGFSPGLIKKLPMLALDILWTDDMLKTQFNIDDNEMIIILEAVA